MGTGVEGSQNRGYVTTRPPVTLRCGYFVSQLHPSLKKRVKGKFECSMAMLESHFSAGRATCLDALPAIATKSDPQPSILTQGALRER